MAHARAVVSMTHRQAYLNTKLFIEGQLTASERAELSPCTREVYEYLLSFAYVARNFIMRDVSA